MLHPSNLWSALKRLSYVIPADDFDYLVRRSDLPTPDPCTPELFREVYRDHVCDEIGWPREFPFTDNGLKHRVISPYRVAEGLVVRSVSGMIEGRTTGSRTRCRANGCPGWFIGVLWETGQQMYLCSEGWHYENGEIQLIGGGEISARFVSPAPLGEHPLPKSQWPARRELLTRRGWRKESDSST